MVIEPEGAMLQQERKGHAWTNCLQTGTSQAAARIMQQFQNPPESAEPNSHIARLRTEHGSNGAHGAHIARLRAPES